MKNPSNNFVNFGEGENQYYENLRKQYKMSPDATYDEIFQEFMTKNGNKFESGKPKTENDEKKNEQPNTKTAENQQNVTDLSILFKSL